MSKIEGTAAVYVVWNDEADEWELHPAMTTGSPLDWAGDDGVPTLREGEGWAADLAIAEVHLERAGNHPITTDDLARMLGSALAQATGSTRQNIKTGHRLASPALIGMLKDAVSSVAAGTLSKDAIGRIVEEIIPIVCSVDQNAHQRGRAEGMVSRT